jgi:protoporphyrinogen oxidase
MMPTVILGGGLAGLSLAHFLDDASIILEKESEVGGMCRSYTLNGIAYDIGPHAVFSKNKEILAMMTNLFEMTTLRRSNKIYHRGRLVKYPFENDLYALDPAEREYCLKEFIDNPYEQYPATNMLQFFLKTFGEGITRLYLQPYNEKIWKFDPSFMDTQMVERIPKPPQEDVIKSAQGIPTEGYLHQLHFHYPRQGGIQQLVAGLDHAIAHKSRVLRSVAIQGITRCNGLFTVDTDKGTFISNKLINCMPLHELFKIITAPDDILRALSALKYNSVYIVVVQASRDTMVDTFASYIADKDIIFHRVSKINFFGENYCLPGGGSTIMAEITFRPGSYLANVPEQEIKNQAIQDLCKLGIIHEGDLTDAIIQSFPYAYVIYDLEHRRTTDMILTHLKELGIACCGRFAEFEYLNMDGIFEHSYRMAKTLNGEKHA